MSISDVTITVGNGSPVTVTNGGVENIAHHYPCKVALLTSSTAKRWTLSVLSSQTGQVSGELAHVSSGDFSYTLTTPMANDRIKLRSAVYDGYSIYQTIFTLQVVGVENGATGLYADIIAGDQNVGYGDNSIVGGHASESNGVGSIALGDRCVTGGNYSVCIGALNETTGPASAAVAIGESLTVSGANAVAIGYASQATVQDAVVMGSGNFARGIGSFVCGSVASADRRGEFAHGSGCVGSQGLHAIDLAAQLVATTGTLKDAAGGSFSLVPYGLESISVRISAATVGHAKAASELRQLLVSSRNPGVTILNEATIWSPTNHILSTYGWSCTITAVSPNELRFTCDAGSDTVTFFARVEWSDLVLV